MALEWALDGSGTFCTALECSGGPCFILEGFCFALDGSDYIQLSKLLNALVAPWPILNLHALIGRWPILNLPLICGCITMYS